MGHEHPSWVIAAAFLMGCSACPRGEHLPLLSEAEVTSISNDAAINSGYDLTKFRAPQLHYEYVSKDCTWTVFYDGLSNSMPNDFTVLVNDNTSRVEIFGGE
jgi:hypothetical protein